MGDNLERPCKVEHQRRPDDGKSVVHEQSREKAHAKEYQEHELIQVPGPSKDAIEKM